MCLNCNDKISVVVVCPIVISLRRNKRSAIATVSCGGWLVEAIVFPFT